MILYLCVPVRVCVCVLPVLILSVGGQAVCGVNTTFNQDGPKILSHTHTRTDLLTSVEFWPFHGSSPHTEFYEFFHAMPLGWWRRNGVLMSWVTGECHISRSGDNVGGK